ncbi:IDEAL domain-containing protein [Bacillus sp. CGMCC 1.16541]|uniref:IDEAL domain-containing protein n=1 Tax=Bacillus sp. CGMCC 1.16541 TaxID=2185143 RepID=UPI000D739BBF|nr:IDEAL domain-containing protein [Bacillus sp. CGMCC 1.16541]
MEKNLVNESYQSEEKVIDALLAEMFLDKVLRDVHEKKLRSQIDVSLKERNKKAFLRLTKELRNI